MIRSIVGPALVASTLSTACRNDVQPVLPPPAEVMTVEAELQFVPIYGEYIGSAEPSLFVEIRARVDGFIEKIDFQEGHAVAKGALLYVIDQRPFQASVEKAQAQLQKAEAAYAKSERDVGRLKPLYEQGAVSQLDYDTALTAQDNARANVHIAKAELAEHELELSYTEIRSPLDGYIGRTRVGIGALVGSKGESLLAVVQRIDPIYINFSMTAAEYVNAKRRDSQVGSVPGKKAADVHTGQNVHILLPDDSEYLHTGTIDFTDPQIDRETGTFRVRAVFPNPDRLILPGLHTQLRLLRDYVSGAILVLRKALQVEQGGAYLYVAMPDDTAEHRFVETGGIYKKSVIITKGLSEGERVVVEGMHKLRPGMRVRIVEPPNNTPAQPESDTTDEAEG